MWTPDVCDPVPETSHSTSEQTKLILDANFSLWKILASILYCDFIKPGNCGMRLKLDENICLERKVNFLPKGAELQFCKKKTFLNTQHPSQLTMNEVFARKLSIYVNIGSKMFDDFVKIHSFKLPNCNKDSQAAASGDKKVWKIFLGLNFQTQIEPGGWWQCWGVIQFLAKKTVGNSIFSKKVRWKFARRQTKEVVGPHKSYSPETIYQGQEK